VHCTKDTDTLAGVVSPAIVDVVHKSGHHPLLGFSVYVIFSLAVRVYANYGVLSILYPNSFPTFYRSLPNTTAGSGYVSPSRTEILEAFSDIDSQAANLQCHLFADQKFVHDAIKLIDRFPHERVPQTLIDEVVHGLTLKRALSCLFYGESGMKERGGGSLEA